MVPQRMFGMTPWVRRLTVANLVALLLRVARFVDPWFLASFGFSPLDALGRPRTFVCSSLSHGAVPHLAFHLLPLHVLARAERHLRRATEPSVLVHPARAARASAAPKPPRAGRDPAQAEIDRVLDKISARGIESLTPAERRFLSEMSRKMRGRS